MIPDIVLISEKISAAAIDVLGQDIEVRYCDGANRDELLTAVADVGALIVRSATRVDASVIAAGKNLKVIARVGVGLDNIDVSAAARAGISVVNAPKSNIISVAELTVGLIIACARPIVTANATLKAGTWSRADFTGVELHGKSVGIIGFGKVGMLVAERLSAFGMRLLAYDPYLDVASAEAMDVEGVTLDELLLQADFVTVHATKTPETVGLVGPAELGRMKKTARIVNTARGGIIDENALATAITRGQLAGAAIDVFSIEPATDSRLVALDSVVVSPHLGASTAEAQEKAGVTVALSVREALGLPDV